LIWPELLRELTIELGSGADARWLIEEVYGRHGDAPVEHRQFELRALVERRMAGVPLQYVLGHWSFRSLDLVVDPRVLIPRPETESVVEIALTELERVRGADPAPVVVDLGTGTGAIAFSVAHEAATHHPGLRVWATDVDEDALAVATLNRRRLGSVDPPAAERVTLRRGSWWRALPPSLHAGVDLVVSNPPYVAEAEWAGLDSQVRLEPYGALVAGQSSTGVPGLEAVEVVVSGAPTWLAPGGILVVEIAPQQTDGALEVARQAGLADPRVERDLAGRNRALVAYAPR
jgi:release factor glutamine methyltransferase